jgi:hypothetical protein
MMAWKQQRGSDKSLAGLKLFYILACAVLIIQLLRPGFSRLNKSANITCKQHSFLAVWLVFMKKNILRYQKLAQR